ncbi:polyprenol monophosphomannose synthase [Patescibacteria group bacterium]|nr:polyprenol monophosphomannose synthase [Patescibacteria group bacterium]MBU1673269.1 polyprenol monophosphomannose synthase [Patescibacteria group bacterium]MBU1964077.1 polyprenol monophosphomannose synthase [Patescibacteria group bacterium]
MNKLIVIPTYNEKENIPKLLEKIFNLEDSFDLLFVDDNSPDGTGKLLDELAVKYENIKVLHRGKKEGLGPAYIAGFKEALKGDYDLIFEMDADLSHHPRFLNDFVNKADQADLVIGSRYMNNRISVVNWPMKRLILSRTANSYVRIVTGLPLTDTTSGFKCFHREVLEAIDFDKVEADGYSFQVEMNYKAMKKGFKLAEVPIVFYDRVKGKSKLDKRIFWEGIWIAWNLKLRS